MQYYIVVLLSTQLEKQSVCCDLFHRHLDVFVVDVPLYALCKFSHHTFTNCE